MGLLLSFVVPAHNEEGCIGKCLKAIKSQVGVGKKTEIIVVNDGSSDRTAEIAKKSGAKVLDFKKGHSASFARNAGARVAKGKYIAFIDADQVVEKKFVEKVAQFVSKHEPDGSDYLVTSFRPRTVFQRGWSAYRKSYPSMGFIHIVKRGVFLKLLFNERIFYHEEIDFKNRFVARYRYAGPVRAFVYHIDPEGWDDFLRQRKWQGRMAEPWYFLPCIFPPIEFFVFLKIFAKSGEFCDSFTWAAIDFIGRYVSLAERIRSIVRGS